MDNFCDNKIQFNKLFPLPPFKNNVLENTLNERTIEKQIGKLSAYTALIPLMPYDIDIKFETPDNEIGYFTGKVRANIGEINVNITFNVGNYPNVTKLYLVYDFIECEVKITSIWDNRYMLLWEVTLAKNNENYTYIKNNKEHNIYYKRMIDTETTANTALTNTNIALNKITTLETTSNKHTNDINTINGEITKLKTNDTKQDNEIQAVQTKTNENSISCDNLDTRVTNIEDNVQYNDLSVYASRLNAVERTSPNFSNIVFIGDENCITNNNKNSWCKYFVDIAKPTTHRIYSTSNLGFSGTTTSLYQYADNITSDENVTTVFLSLGINDYGKTFNKETVANAVNKIMSKFVNAKFYYAFDPVYSLQNCEAYRIISSGLSELNITDVTVLPWLVYCTRSWVYTNDSSPTRGSLYYMLSEGNKYYAQKLYNYLSYGIKDSIKSFTFNGKDTTNTYDGTIDVILNDNIITISITGSSSKTGIGYKLIPYELLTRNAYVSFYNGVNVYATYAGILQIIYLYGNADGVSEINPIFTLSLVDYAR